MNNPSQINPARLTLPSRPAAPELQAILLCGLTTPAEALRQAQALVQNLSASGASPAYRAQATLTLGIASNRAERYVAAQAILSDALLQLAHLGLNAEAAIGQWQLGIAQRAMRRNAGFLAQLETAVSALHTAGLPVEAALCQRDLAVACNWRGDYARSAELTTSVRRFFEARGQPLEAALCATIESAQLRWRGRLDEALAVLLTAGQQLAEAHLPVEQATLGLYCGAVHTARMRFDQALSYLQPARAAFEQLDLPVRLTLCRNELGNIALAQGDLQQAERSYLASRAATHLLDLPADHALALLNLANVRYYQGDLLEARLLYRAAQLAFETLGDPLSSLNCQQNLGLIQASLGEFAPAIRQLSAVAARLTAVGAQMHLAATHHMLGRAWLDLGDPAQAGTHFAEAQTLYLQADAAFPAARARLHQALAEAEQGRWEPALAQIEAVRLICQAHQAQAYLAMCDQIAGRVQLEAGQAAAALPLLRAAELAFVRLNMPVNAAACQVAQAEAYLLLKQTVVAERLFEQVLDQFGAALPDLAWRCTAGLARLLAERQEYQAALARHQQTISKLTWLRGPLDHELLVDGFIARRGAALNQALQAAVTHGSPELALTLVEASRSRLLARRFGWRQPPAEPAPPPLNSEITQLRQTISALRFQLSQTARADPRLLQQRPPNQAALLQQLETAAKRYEHLTATLPLIEAPATIAPPPFDLAAVRAHLNQTNPAGWTILAYYWLDQQLVTFMVTADHVQCWETQPQPLNRLALELCTTSTASHRRLLYHVTPPTTTRAAQASRTYRQALYQWLIPVAVQARLTPEHLLLIVPAGPLHGLPFQALLAGPTHLAEQATVLLAPSLHSLVWPITSAPQPNCASAVIVAVETFANGLPRLLHVQRETEQLQRCLGTPHLLSGPAATRQAVTTALLADGPNAPALAHFATHAVFEAGLGRLSRIALHDGDWQADEIAQLHLNLSLVVLSACQAALGQVRLGEEVVGLTQAFRAAGATSVLAALWSLPDATAADFMIAFYTRLVIQPASPHFALAATQRAWIAAGRSPYEWAPYVLSGQLHPALTPVVQHPDNSLKAG